MSAVSLRDRFLNASEVMISVHRGLWGPLPENSVSAIRAAAGWDVVEIDLQLDANGRAFVFHDRSFLRMTGQDISTQGVARRTLTGLNLRAGAGGEGAEMTEAHVPYLDEAFEALGSSDAVFDLDVKRPEDLVTVAGEVAALGETHRATLKATVSCQQELEALKALEQAFDIMVIAKVRLETAHDLEVLRALKAAGVAVAEVGFGSLELLKQGVDVGGPDMRLSVYTLENAHCCGLSDQKGLADPDAVWGRLIALGVCLILTDQPDAVTALLRHDAA